MTGTIEPIVGRYVSVEIAGRTNRVYFEEAGQGIPLLCLHTAGSDARQFRHMLNDAAITDTFRVIAFDMPWHGKSSPPDGWQDEEYALSTDLYIETILAVADALGLDRPVGMGCSIGGRVMLQLAARHPDRFRALIGLQAAAFQDPWYDRDWLDRPDIHGGRVCAALVSGLVAPTAPDADRHETLWHYMQGGPGIFKGDLYFYRVDGDLRPVLAEIDTERCPLYLLTGTYDHSCLPADSERTARAIPGARYIPMEGLGHFPMSEDHAQFMKYLMPVLDELNSADSQGE